MRLKLGSGLIPINILLVVSILAVVLLPWPGLRLALAIPYVLLFPGYTLMLALFPQRDRMGGPERLALSLGLSLAVIPLGGLLLNYLPWGITTESVLYFVAVFTFLMSVIAFIILQRLDKDDCFSLELAVMNVGLGDGRDKLMALLLVACIVGAGFGLNYVLNAPRGSDLYTEMYILGLESDIGEYPYEVAPGEVVEVTLGVINNEQQTVEYRLEIIIDNEIYTEAGPFSLDDDREWRQAVSFTPDTAGRQQVEFRLYRSDRDGMYLSTHMWINVD